ncbi:MAG: hypothetical protein NTW51_09065 [Cyanobacteria bacterium]|nr:hypothetical protein [Cyanobacteriota bacterium]
MLLLCQGRADAILNYYIFEDGGNLKIVTTGSLNLGGLASQAGSTCTGTSPGGTLTPGSALICSGVETSSTDPYKKYVVEPVNPGTTSFTAGSDSLDGADSTTGTRNWLWGGQALDPSFYIVAPYTDGAPINSSATFIGKSLTDVGLDMTTSGTNIGSWTFFNDTNPNNVINVFVGDPPNAPVPAPPLLIGAAGAYGWSRRLRRRIGSAGNR